MSPYLAIETMDVVMMTIHDASTDMGEYCIARRGSLVAFDLLKQRSINTIGGADRDDVDNGN
jgi:hypothetical protein